MAECECQSKGFQKHCIKSAHSYHDAHARRAACALSPPDFHAFEPTLLVELLMQDLAIGILFGDDRERARPIARMITRQAAAWPFPGRDYFA
ncbi:MAG: hypothetical protein ACTSSQ_02330 [Alphaproteobacteria bacterium]